MYKIIYDKTSGQIRATVNSGQSLDQVMSNYSNVDFLSVDKIIVDKFFNKRVNLESLTVEDHTITAGEPS
jgi:hypothetical protein